MSQWTHVDAHMGGVKADLSGEPTPEGSEGGHPLRPIGRDFPGGWYWYADLRDLGEEDAPDIRDWFTDLCQRTQPREATLQIDVESGGRYDFTWKDGTLVLEVPPLYRL